MFDLANYFWSYNAYFSSWIKAWMVLPHYIILKHFLLVDLTDANKIVDSRYEFSVVDANSLAFLFKHAPEAAKMLHFSSEMSFEEGYHSDSSSWVVSKFLIVVDMHRSDVFGKFSKYIFYESTFQLPALTLCSRCSGICFFIFLKIWQS